jgi:hypothetical protein
VNLLITVPNLTKIRAAVFKVSLPSVTLSDQRWTCDTPYLLFHTVFFSFMLEQVIHLECVRELWAMEDMTPKVL